MKVILVMCVQNEEKFIGQVLQRTARFTDIDYIHILHGYWWHPGIEEKLDHGMDLNSSDNTSDEIKNNSPHTFIEMKSKQLYLSESDKRNFQLSLIEESHKNNPEPVYVMILDGDEELVFANDTEEKISLKEIILSHKGTGMVLCEGYGFSEQRFTARIFQLGIGIHYHTGTQMCLHDCSCEIINDYKNDIFDRFNTYPVTEFKIVNYWSVKGKERILEKDSLFQVLKDRKIRKCEYKKQ